MNGIEKKAADSILPVCVTEGFEIEGTPVSVSPLGDGHINKTFKVSFRDDSGSVRKYVFQRVNTNVFKDPVGLMENVIAVTGHIRKKAAASGYDAERATLNFIPAAGGGYLVRDGQGGYWRAYAFIDDCIVYEQAEKPEDMEKAGVALGRFQKMLADFPSEKLHETIPAFHNTVSRFENFERTLAADPAGRAASCIPETEFVLSRKAYCSKVLDAVADGRIPLHVTHNDTKLNNVLLDSRTGDVLCMIDLDTVMPGSVLYDFGDSVRFGASSAAEDEKDLSRVRFVPEYYDAFRRGYLAEAGDSLTGCEIDMLPFSAVLITYEIGMRFLTDYIDGDNYFAVSRPEHNLDRARTQFKLVSDMEEYFGIRA